MSRKRHKGKGKKPVIRVAAKPADVVTPDTLDALVAERYHGAANIRGVRFQVRYSVLRCAQLAAAQRRGETAGDGLRFEGLEDLDALGGDRPLVASADELVQVKSSAEGWSWAKLCGPVANFLEAFRAGDERLHFRLVIDFEPKGKLADLKAVRELSAPDRARFAGDFRKLVRRLGGADNEADQMLDRMVLESLQEGELRRITHAALSEAIQAVDVGALDTLEAVLAAKALLWASERKTVVAPDVLDALRVAVEGLQHAARYQAVERRWVGPIEYAGDAVPDDFFDGKRTRLGHVVAGLDVRRPRWLARIGAALEALHVCVVRAPSGHGKSTLAYRFAVENWPASQTIRVRSVGNAEEVAAVSDYIRYRVKIGAPLHVLVDADVDTRRWAEVAQAAAAAGAKVLITVRVEDWQRYDLSALTSKEIVEPGLDVQEATEIFLSLRARGRVHPAVRSAGEAFERLRPPHLLLEFVHLVTHGRMLEERLRDQVHAFVQLGEDPAKKRLLRLLSLTNALGVPVQLAAAVRAVPLRDDPQDVIGTLMGEYVSLQEGQLVALHRVRSEHLSRVLHEGGIPSVTETAVEALSSVSPEALPTFIANILRRNDIDREVFLARLAEHVGGRGTQTILAALDGMFEAGERDFFTANRPLFEEAHAILGSTGVFLLAADAAPIHPVGALRRLCEIVRNEPSAPAHRLEALQQKLQHGQRGLDLVRRFLDTLAPRIELEQASSESGAVMEWCALAGVRLGGWDASRSRLIMDSNVLRRGIDAVCDFAQGFFRYDRVAYHEWYERLKGDLLPFLQLETECVSLDVIPQEATDGAYSADPEWDEKARQDRDDNGAPVAEVMISYLVVPESGLNSNEQSVRRLRTLRRALPFAGVLKSKGLVFLPAGLTRPVDDSRKAIPRWNLPLPADIAKNTVLQRVVLPEFSADTSYGLQQEWHTLRSHALHLAEAIATILQSLVERRQFSPGRILGPGEKIVAEFENAVKTAPLLREEELELIGPLSDEFRALVKQQDSAKWAEHFKTFRRQLWAFFNDRVEREGRLAVQNFRESQQHLPGMQEFFRVHFNEHPDYFGACELNARELRVYAHIDLLLEGWVLDPLTPGPGSALERLAVRRKARVAAQIERVRMALCALGPAANGVVYPTAINETSSVRSMPLGIPVSDPLLPATDLLAVCAALVPVADVADFFWLFPLKNGALIGTGAHHVSTRAIRGEGLTPSDLSVAALGLAVPIDPPDEVTALLPDLPRVEPPAPNLPQKIAALVVASRWYVHQRDAIASVRGAERHPRLLELEERLRKRLSGMEAESHESIRTLAAEVAALGAGSDAAVAAARSCLHDWLLALDQALDSDRIAEDSPVRWTPEESEAAIASAVLIA